MTLDYLSSNALNKYPFTDTASLKSAEGPYLSNDTILDLVVAAKQAAIKKVYLSSYISNTGTSQFTLVFTYMNAVNAVLGTFSVVIPFASVVERNTYGVADAALAVKIVFGPQFVLDKGLSLVRTFDASTGLLARSAVVLMVPRVSSVSFYNWDKDSEDYTLSPIVISGDETSALDLTLEEGSNVHITQSAKGAAISILSGLGTGLFNACDEAFLTIKKIDDVGPDVNHNFLLVTDDCYVTDPVAYGLVLTNNCTPKCSKEQLDDFTYYLNRVRDGMEWVTTYAQTVSASVRTEIDNFTTNVQPNQNKPSYKIKLEKFATVDPSRFYFSIAIGFFNATTGDLPLSFVANTTSSTTGVVLNTIRYREGNSTVILEEPTYNVDVPCLSMSILEFVVSSSDNSDIVSLTGSFGGLSINETIALL